MKLLYRSRALLQGLELFSAFRCIDGLAKIKSGKVPADFGIQYRKSGTRLKAEVRGKHLSSDIQTVLELAAGDCYRLNKISWEPEVVFDCGGNTGLFTLAATTRWPQAQVYCFEPMPDNYKAIQRNIDLNGLKPKVQLIKAAVGNSERSARFFMREANQGSLDNSLEYGQAIDVQVNRLWHYYEQHSNSNTLIKMDIEGGEYEVLADIFSHKNLRKLVMLLEVHGGKDKQDQLLEDATRAGFIAKFWEQASETAHLFLATKDVGLVMKD